MKTYNTFDLIHEYGTQVLTKCKSPYTLSFFVVHFILHGPYLMFHLLQPHTVDAV